MTAMTKDDLNRAVAHRDTKCALTGAPVAKDEECFWVMGVGLIRGDLDPDEILAKLANFTAKFPPRSTPDFILAQRMKIDAGEVSYQDLCEVIACELEEALAELKRRGIDYHFDTDGLVEYRDLHPRQDS